MDSRGVRAAVAACRRATGLTSTVAAPATSPVDQAWSRFLEVVAELAAAEARATALTEQADQAEAAFHRAITAALRDGDPVYAPERLRMLLAALGKRGR